MSGDPFDRFLDEDVHVPAPPCCDYRDHRYDRCSCPEHPRSVLHFLGYEAPR